MCTFSCQGDASLSLFLPSFLSFLPSLPYSQIVHKRYVVWGKKAVTINTLGPVFMLQNCCIVLTIHVIGDVILQHTNKKYTVQFEAQ